MNEQPANQNPYATPSAPEPAPNVIHASPQAPIRVRKLITPRVIFGILALVIIGELIYAYNSLKPKGQESLVSSPTQSVVKEVASLSKAKISLIADKKEYKVGDNVSIAARVFTGGRSTAGTDLIVNYDPAFLEANINTGITLGKIYTDYPIKSVEPAKGLIRVSGISSINTPGFNGNGIMASLVFKAKKAGNTTIKLDYAPNKTADSNVIDSSVAEDILEEVKSASIVIGANSTADTAACGAKVYQTCVNSNGQTGSYWCTPVDDPYSCSTGCFVSETSDVTGCSVTTTK